MSRHRKPEPGQWPEWSTAQMQAIYQDPQFEMQAQSPKSAVARLAALQLLVGNSASVKAAGWRIVQLIVGGLALGMLLGLCFGAWLL